MKLRAQLLLVWTLVGCNNHEITAAPFRNTASESERPRATGAQRADAGSGDPEGPTAESGPPSEALMEAEDHAVFSSALPRLSHRQWALAAQDLLKLESPPDVSRFSADPLTGTGFDNTSDHLEVSPALWSDYQTLSEALAAEVSSDAAKLKKLLPTQPAADAAERSRTFVSQLGERAFRRPLTAKELDQYLALFNSAPELFPERDAFAAGAELTIAALLQAPALIYRLQDKGSPDADGLIARSDLELATQLSMMLWDSPPDASLMEAAKAGALHAPSEIENQAKRLLASPRAQEKLLDFFRQWLELRTYDALHPESLPPAIGLTLHEEAKRFIQAALLDESGSLAELFTATFTFVNRDLAKLYDVEGDFGDDWVRTELDATQRAGFLTRIGFLITTAGQTAPIHRGVFVNRKLLCASLPPPPNFTPGKMVGDTRRQRIDSITGAGTCGAGCHATLINPAGYPLEYFDDLGRYREQDNGHAIDGQGDYPFSEGSQSYADPIAFSRVLAGSRQAHACYAKHLLEFALGRPAASGDSALLERLSNASRAQQASVKDLVLLLTESKSFRYRQAEEP